MKRRVNVRRTAIILGVALAGCCALHALHEWQLRRSLGAWKAQAGRFAEAGNAGASLACFRQYLTYRPNDGDALAAYGRLLDETAVTSQDRAQAAAALDRALSIHPEHIDVRKRSARLALRQGNYLEARRHLHYLRSLLPHDPDGAYLYGACLEGLGEYEQAAALYEQTIDQHATQIPIFSRLAELYRLRLGEPHKVRAVLDRMVAANPSSSQAYLVRALFARDQQMRQQAAADLERALHLAPSDPDVLMVAADLVPELRPIQELRQGIEEALRQNTAHAGLYRSLVMVELKTGHSDAALAWLRQGVQSLPNQPELLELLCDLLIQRDELAEATQIERRLQQMSCLSAKCGYWKARLLMKQGRLRPAVQVLEQAASQVASVPAWSAAIHSALGACYEQLGDHQRELVSYRRASAEDPTALTTRLCLARALLATNRAADAVLELRQLAGRTGVPAESWTLLAQALYQRNLQLPAESRDWPGVEETLRKASNALGETVALVVLHASVLAAQQRWSDAERILTEARDRRPAQPGYWVALADLADRQGNSDAAAGILAEARAHVRAPFDLRLAEARILVRHGGGSSLFEDLEQELKALSADERHRCRMTVAELSLQARDQARAERLALEAAHERIDDVRSRLLLLDLYLDGDRPEAYQRVLDEVRHIEGEDGTQWRMAQVAQLLHHVRRGQRVDLGLVRQRLDEITRRSVKGPRVFQFEAELALLQGKKDAAIEHFLHALDLGTLSGESVERLLQLLVAQSRYGEASLVMDTLARQRPITGTFARTAAEIALSQGDRNRAVEWASQAVSKAPHDPRARLWLGQALDNAGRAEEAEAAFREAVGQASSTPATWTALVRHLSRAGKTAEARAEIPRMQETLAGEQLALALAECYEALGDRLEAEAQFRIALAAAPEDFTLLRRVAQFYVDAGPAARGVPYLRRLLSAEVAAPGEWTIWARRQLARILAADGSDASRRQALVLLDRNRSLLGKEHVEDQRIRAQVLATRPARCKEALSLLEQTREQAPWSVPDRHLLARLYVAAGKPDRARECYLELLATPRPRADHVADYVRFLLSTGALHEARPWFLRLQRMEPEAVRTLEIEHELWLASTEPMPR